MKKLQTMIFLGLAAVLLSGCGGMTLKAIAPQMPKPLIVPFPADVGVFYGEDLTKFKHDEERWGAKWSVDLGESHVAMMNALLGMAFHSVAPVPDPRTQPAVGSVGIMFQPHIDQFSFITPRDSGGAFFAVTIKYRLEVFAPDGRLADTLTLTGYGGALATGFSSSTPMQAATQAAMRDAAAKFLVQFPEQKIAQKLRAGEPLIEDKPPPTVAAVTGDEDVKIEPVPIFPPKPPETL